MTPVLRIAVSFFSIVPLQRWMNWLGAALLALALLTLGRDVALMLAVPAAFLLASVPAFSGGVALRYACTPSLLHLRPHGRVRLLLGATLALTLTAAAVALPFQIDAWSRDFGSLQRAPVPPVWIVFQLAWSVIVLSWLCFFVLCRSQAAYAMFGIIPLLVLTASRHVLKHVDTIQWVLPAAVLLWIAFGIWLMRTHSVARPAVMPSGASSDAHPFSWLMNILPQSGGTSTSHATSLHLLGGSTSMFIVNGVWVALIFLVVQFGIARGNRNPGADSAMFMLPFLGFMFAAVGFTTARRARMLWLRSGLDRSALFRQAETLGLRAMLISWIIPAAAIILAVSVRTDRPLPVLLFVAQALALAIGLFYGGMAMTRGVCVRDALLALGLGGLFMFELALLTPARLDSLHALIVLGITVTATAALRYYAQRSWQRLDWRIAKMPPPAMRTT